jgi:putative hemolysin
MQANPVRMALVIDELGTVEGIVTAADVLGAIAGETAFSEGDRLPSPVMRDDGSWLVDGRTALEDLEILLSVPSLGEDAGVSTIAGLIMHHLQRVPSLGDHVADTGWRFEVVDMDGRRVDSVLISRIEADSDRTSLAD